MQVVLVFMVENLLFECLTLVNGKCSLCANLNNVQKILKLYSDECAWFVFPGTVSFLCAG